MLNIVLYQPQIPPNTGNIIRLAANTGARLHLIRPLGFELEDKKLRRAGLDYHELSRVTVHEDWQAFRSVTGAGRIFGVSTKGQIGYCDVAYREDDFIVFGPETCGLPPAIRDELGGNRVLRIPMRAGNRSLNLANAAAVLVYEAWRQQGFSGGS